MLAVALVAASVNAAGESAAPSATSKARPQAGDQLVFADGEHAGQQVTAAQLSVGAAPQSAWPGNPSTQRLRDGSRLNLVRVLRLAPDALSPRAAEHAPEGIIAYASLCSHAGCDVTG